MERKTTSTLKETVHIEDDYYGISIAKTNGKVKSITFRSRNHGDMLFSISSGYSDKSRYSFQAKVEEIRDLLNVALSEIKDSTD